MSKGLPISGARNRLDGAEATSQQAKPVVASTGQLPLIEQLDATLNSDENVIDFIHFKNEIRAVIELLRA